MGLNGSRNGSRWMALGLSLLALAIMQPARADEKLAGKACRSVHLRFRAGQGSAFVNAVTVERSAPGTYFCVGGFKHGYLGIQELGDRKKVAIFSVWDSNRENDPNAVPVERRVKLIDQGEGVRIGRFGNEGTGGQSFLDLDWKDGERYTFLITARPDGERTTYSAYVSPPGATKWQLIAAFSTITGGDWLSGYYAFVEDFRRNRVSATQERIARFGPAWVKLTEDQRWHQVDSATFTGDSNPSTAIDAGVREGAFFLATGGATRNEHTPLKERILLPDAAADPRESLPQSYPPLP